MGWNEIKELFIEIFDSMPKKETDTRVVSGFGDMCLFHKSDTDLEVIQTCEIEKFDEMGCYRVKNIPFRVTTINAIQKYFGKYIQECFLSLLKNEDGEELHVLVCDLGECYLALAQMTPEEYPGEHGESVNKEPEIGGNAFFL